MNVMEYLESNPEMIMQVVPDQIKLNSKSKFQVKLTRKPTNESNFTKKPNKSLPKDVSFRKMTSRTGKPIPRKLKKRIKKTRTESPMNFRNRGCYKWKHKKNRLVGNSPEQVGFDRRKWLSNSRHQRKLGISQSGIISRGIDQNNNSFK